MLTEQLRGGGPPVWGRGAGGADRWIKTACVLLRRLARSLRPAASGANNTAARRELYVGGAYWDGDTGLKHYGASGLPLSADMALPGTAACLRCLARALSFQFGPELNWGLALHSMYEHSMASV